MIGYRRRSRTLNRRGPRNGYSGLPTIDCRGLRSPSCADVSARRSPSRPEEGTMTSSINRRDLMQAVAAGAAAVSIAAPSVAQAAAANAPPEDYFYRDDYFGEPWRA